MSIQSMIESWEAQADDPAAQPTPPSSLTCDIHLPIELAAKLAALHEIYPDKTESQLASELITHALGQIPPSSGTQH